MMATTQTAVGSSQRTRTGTQMESADKAESLIRTIDESTKESTGISLFHILTLGSIGASLALFFSGNRQAGIFVGLWPPTFQALKAVADTNKENRKV
ncbi:MAG: hypothetical protein H0W76_10960 [Pyrinomonadaceae bacterium]|nr:hypothetical protein [Pyrinomonadaceae bacterium]